MKWSSKTGIPEPIKSGDGFLLFRSVLGVLTSFKFAAEDLGIFTRTQLARGYKVLVPIFTQQAPATGIAAGPLKIGRLYEIEAGNTTGVFTNVGAADNNPGTQFIATGTTPTSFGDGTLESFGEPVVSFLQNTFTGDITWTRIIAGKYRGTFSVPFDPTKIYVPGFSTNFNSTGDASIFLPVSTNGNPQLGWINITFDDVAGEWIQVESLDMTGYIEFSDLFGDGNLCLPKIEVYI